MTEIDPDKVYEIPPPYDDECVYVADTDPDRTRDEARAIVQLVINGLDPVEHDEFDVVQSLSKMGFVSIQPRRLRVTWKR